MLRAIEWKQHRLMVVDQDKLPGKVGMVQCRNPRQIADFIQTKKIQGAGAVGVAAAFAIYLGVKITPLAKTFEKFSQQINAMCEMLAKAGSGFQSVTTALERMRQCANSHRDHKLLTLRDILLREALAIQKEEEQASKHITQNAGSLIREGDTVLTLGNTGALSSSGPGTALGAIIGAHVQRKDMQVLVCETRPDLNGMCQAALELKQHKVSFHMISDNMAGYLMKKGMVDVVMVGADRVAANGDVVAQNGAYTLAVLAYTHTVPFYVAASLAIFDRNLLSGEGVFLEEKKNQASLTLNGKKISLPGVKHLSSAFDLTPQKYVSAIITELGIVRAPYDQNLRNLFSNVG